MLPTVCVSTWNADNFKLYCLSSIPFCAEHTRRKLTIAEREGVGLKRLQFTIKKSTSFGLRPALREQKSNDWLEIVRSFCS